MRWDHDRIAEFVTRFVTRFGQGVQIRARRPTGGVDARFDRCVKVGRQLGSASARA
jgi:hypothetical protein